MGADWYVIRTLYGYAFDLSSYPSYRALVRLLYQLQPFVASPFQIIGILSEFHSRMEFDETDNVYLDRFASVLVGFVPDVDLERTATLAKELSEYIVDNPIFEGFDIVMTPRFFSGIEWYPNEIEESEDSSLASSISSLSASASASTSASASDSSGSWTADESSDPHPSDAEVSLTRVSSEQA